MSRLRTLTELSHRAGPGEAALFLGLSVASRVAALKVLQVVAITADRLDTSYLGLDAGYSGRFADRDWLLDQAARYPELGMSQQFVRDALARGDRCYAINAGEALVSYGWYSNRPTHIDNGLMLAFDPLYVYMYKGFTHPGHRGRRLHAVGMTRALAAVVEQGFCGLVSFVERTNCASLKSVHRMGYRDVVKYAVLAVRDSHRIMRIGGRGKPEVTVRRAVGGEAIACVT